MKMVMFMINRVYLYNEELSKKNKTNYSPVKSLLILVVFFGGPLLVLKILQNLNINVSFPIVLLLILSSILLPCIIFYVDSNILMSKIRVLYSDIYGNLYFLDNNNNGREYFRVGASSQHILKRHDNNFSDSIGNIAMITGTAAALNEISDSFKNMQNPDYCVQLLEDSFNNKSCNGYQILNVYNINHDKSFIKITCDYKNLYNGKIKRKRVIKIYNSYTGIEEFIDLLKKRVIQ